MDRVTGRALSDQDHIAQSIGDILGTPVGTRVMRRDYGALLFELVDLPMNGATRLLALSAAAMAIARWEPRVAVTRLGWAGDFAAGQAAISLTAQVTAAGSANALARMTIPLAAALSAFSA